jgi:hypothetical protein
MKDDGRYGAEAGRATRTGSPALTDDTSLGLTLLTATCALLLSAGVSVFDLPHPSVQLALDTGTHMRVG